VKELDYMVTRTYPGDGGPPNTQIVPRNFVAPLAPTAPPAINLQSAADTALQHASAAEIDASALQGMRTVSETSTPVQRAYAIAIEGAFICAVALIASYALDKAGASGAQVNAFFICLLLAGVAILVWFNYTHSPIGNERHKVTAYKQVQQYRIASDERVQMAKLNSFDKLVEKTYGQTSHE
jgi:hypothetical protein